MAGLLSSLKETLVSPSAPVTDSDSGNSSTPAAEKSSSFEAPEEINGNEEA